MSLLSRNTGGRRASAKMAAVFAGTLLTFLVATAIPAAAVASACSTAGPIVTVTIGTDARAILDPAQSPFAIGGNYTLLVDGSAVGIDCGAAPSTSKEVDINGTNDGTETVVLYQPDDMSGDNVIVNLGNGSDTLQMAYGGTSWNQTGVLVVQLPDPATNDLMGIGTAANGTAVANFGPPGTSADLRVDNAENLIASMGFGTDIVDAGLQLAITANSVIPVVTTDDIPAGVSPLNRAITVFGEAGNDTFFSGAGPDTFNGGNGTDLVDYIAASAGVTVDLGAGTGATDLLIDVQNVNGSNFADTITGSPLDNALDGRDGNDTIDGSGGNDTITGGADSGVDPDTNGGDDTLSGGAGNDTVQGQDGDDTINEDAAANGADLLSGGAGDDTLDHSARTTPVTVIIDGIANDGAAGEADFVGPDFENYLGGSAADHYEGSGSNERFQPMGGDDFVDGNGAGGDLLDISEATTDTTVDLPNGTANGNGNDTFTDIEAVATGSGNDTVLWDGLTPLVNFIADGGIDTVDASQATVGVAINLAAFGNGNEVENATGGAGNDTLTGNSLNNTLIGNDGIDTIVAGLGNDFVEGGLGNDTISDGGGADTLSYRHATCGETIDTANGFAEGCDGSDSLAGVFETVLGSDFADNITAGQTAFDAPNILKGYKGNDIITGSNSTDLIRGGGGNDDLRGGGGDDTIRGSGGNDTLLGSSGDDILKGGNGEDSLVGGRGYDIGNGGKGNDTCRQVEQRHSC